METVKAPLKAELGAPQLDNQDPAEPVFTPLLMEERDRLNEIFRDPAFVKAWRNLRVLKPGVFIASPAVLSGPTGPQLANNRLHEIRGWEMFVAALLNQGKEPVVKRKAVLEEYPDAGTIEAEMQRTAGPVPVRAVPGQPKPPTQQMPVAKITSNKTRKP